MLLFYDIFLLGIIFITLMICLVLVIKSKGGNKSNIFLASTLFIISWYSTIYLLINTGLILKCTFLFGWGTPMYYLIPPLCYWYALSILKPDWKLKKIDLLHLITPLIGLIDAITIVTSSEKYVIIEQIVNDFNHVYLYDTTWIPQKIHFIFRPTQGLVYMSVIWALLIPSFIRDRHFFSRKLNKDNNWLLIFIFLITIIYIALAISTYIGLSNNSENHKLFDIIQIPLIFIVISFFGLGIYLFFTPSILYGLENPSKKSAKNAVTDKKVESFNKEQIALHVELLEKYMGKESTYTRQGISINDVASETGIPARTLSFILNHHYNLRFNDFINKYRIAYITKKLDEGYWKHITLEGLALEAGFSSRSTFFSAFKKIIGKSPSQYIETLQE
jgi:AraC-like DNA-binding protein